jgi:hypothetical protein
MFIYKTKVTIRVIFLLLDAPMMMIIKYSDGCSFKQNYIFSSDMRERERDDVNKWNWFLQGAAFLGAVAQERYRVCSRIICLQYSYIKSNGI